MTRTPTLVRWWCALSAVGCVWFLVRGANRAYVAGQFETYPPNAMASDLQTSAIMDLFVAVAFLGAAALPVGVLVLGGWVQRMQAGQVDATALHR